MDPLEITLVALGLVIGVAALVLAWHALNEQKMSARQTSENFSRQEEHNVRSDQRAGEIASGLNDVAKTTDYLGNALEVAQREIASNREVVKEQDGRITRLKASMLQIDDYAKQMAENAEGVKRNAQGVRENAEGIQDALRQDFRKRGVTSVG